jgi:hypothetical protein
MSVFDENKSLTKEFLEEQGFVEYNKGYFYKSFITYRYDEYQEDNTRFSVEVKVSLPYNNVYVEKTPIYEHWRYWRHRVSDQYDFFALISKYKLEEDKL